MWTSLVFSVMPVKLVALAKMPSSMINVVLMPSIMHIDATNSMPIYPFVTASSRFITKFAAIVHAASSAGLSFSMGLDSP